MGQASRSGEGCVDSRAGSGVRRLTALCCGVLLSACWGCGGGDLGQVSGKVTLDGQPLAGAEVMFMPSEGGGVSVGRADSQGNYSLMHSEGSRGAVIGMHSVSITLEEPDEEEDEGPDLDDGAPLPKIKPKPNKPAIVIPDRYSDNTELTANVESGKQTFDWQLTTN